VLRLASALWRLRRATGIETALFEAATADPVKAENEYSRPTLVGGADLAEQNLLRVAAARRSDATTPSSQGFGAEKSVADNFLRLAALPTFPLDRLSRYECMLWRQARQLVFLLESFRRRNRLPNRSRFPFSLRR
jgi:hypothetical protein